MNTISIIEETEARVITLYEISQVINEAMTKESSFGTISRFDTLNLNGVKVTTEAKKESQKHKQSIVKKITIEENNKRIG
jgi:hypothetical protein